MNHGNSGLAHGTSGSPQLTIDNGDMAAKAKENEKNIRNNALKSQAYIRFTRESNGSRCL